MVMLATCQAANVEMINIKGRQNTMDVRRQDSNQ